jgi:hypothetical protein
MKKITGNSLDILRALQTLKVAQKLHGTGLLLLAAPADLGPHLLRRLPPHQRLLLRRLHLPDYQRRLGRHLLRLPVLGARHVARLHRQHHGVHEVLGCLDAGLEKTRV